MSHPNWSRGWTSSALWVSVLAAGVVVACSADDSARSRKNNGNDPSNPNGSGGSGGDSQGLIGGFGATRSDPQLGNYQPPKTPAECGSSKAGARELRRLTRTELVNTLTQAFTELAEAMPESLLSADPKNRMSFSNDVDTLLVGAQTAKEVLDHAEDVGDAVVGSLATLLPCAGGAKDAACAAEYIEARGRKLFRRPITDAERDQYNALFTSVSGKATFEAGIKWVTVAMIQSPATLYRSELGADGGAGAFKLTPYELAAELSYNFSANPPSDELVQKALDGKLEDPAARRAEALALLKSAEGQEVVQRFFEEWLSYGGIIAQARTDSADTSKPLEGWDGARSSMVQETREFVGRVFFTEPGKLTDLFTAPYTHLDAALASFYGFGTGTAAFTKVPRPAGKGVGLFALGAFLTITSQTNFPSPTRRGLVMMERVLCTPRPLPANNVMMDVTSSEGNTVREKIQNAHAKPEACNSCHRKFDPLGFGFENYDHAGRYRTEERNEKGSFPVDANTVLEILAGQEISSQEELMAELSKSDLVKSCVSGTLAQYILGGNEACRATTARQQLIAGELTLVDYLAALAAEQHITERR